MSDVFLELQRLLSLAAVELFDGYGVPAAHLGGDPPNPETEHCVVASIGFAAADGSRGSLVLVASRAVVAALQPPELGMHSDTAICDILGEFANMLLGRLKNMLLPRGVTLMLGTPITAMALKLWLSSPFTPCSWLAFEVGGHPVHVRLDASLAESFELADEAACSAPDLAEGDMILF
jgi:hypothetical protein